MWTKITGSAEGTKSTEEDKIAGSAKGTELTEEDRNRLKANKLQKYKTLSQYIHAYRKMISWYIHTEFLHHKTFMVVSDEDFHKQKYLFDGKVDYKEDFGKMTLNIVAILPSLAIWDFTNEPNEFPKKIRKCFIDGICN